MKEVTEVAKERSSRCAELEAEMKQLGAVADNSATDTSQLKANLQKAMAGFKKARAIAGEARSGCNKLQAEVTALNQKLSDAKADLETKDGKTTQHHRIEMGELQDVQTRLTAAEQTISTQQEFFNTALDSLMKQVIF